MRTLAAIAFALALATCPSPLRAAIWHQSLVLAEGVMCEEDALGCAGPANPEVIAAVKKRYPKADDDAWAFDERFKGKGRYSVTFFNDDGYHISCKLKLKPIRLAHCGIVHA